VDSLHVKRNKVVGGFYLEIEDELFFFFHKNKCVFLLVRFLLHAPSASSYFSDLLEFLPNCF
jgi:hypothetical protein